MPTGDNGEVTPGELVRRVNDVLARLEKLVQMIEERYVRKDILELYQRGIDLQVAQIESSVKQKADAGGLAGIDKKADLTVVQGLVEQVRDKAEEAYVKTLEARIASLEGWNVWLTRIIGSFLVLGILGAVFVVGGGVGK